MRLIQTIEECCPVVGAGPLETVQAERIASAFKALSDPTRLRLLGIIAAQPSGECCVCDLTGPAGVSQPTVSHHLKILHDAGLLDRTKRGTWAYYRLVPGALDTLRDALRYDGSPYTPKSE